MYIIIEILAGIIILQSIIMWKYQRQVKDICRQLAFLMKHDSNMLIHREFGLGGIGMLSDRLNDLLELRRKEKQYYQEKETLIADTYTNLSHDIRTPLTSLDGYFQLMEACENVEEQRRYLNIIHERIHSLNEMLEELFMFTKLKNESYSLELTSCCINRILKETVFLNNDREMPLLGLGVYKLPDDVQAEAAVTSAISAGYRMIDTASVYKNEESVGRAIAKCGVPRKDLFITSKIWNNAQRLGDVQGAFSRSLDRLKVSYVDLYLIHWPVPGCYLSTWKELESILESGRALSIGVSNFDIRHLEELRKISGVIPAVNQIECHPLCYPAELIEYCKAFGIQVQAYAPLARGAYFDNDVMCVLGTKYARTPAQIGLRWAIQKGISVIPKSINPERIRSNGNIFDFNIEDEDMAIIDTLNEDLHTSHVPEDLRDIQF